MLIGSPVPAVLLAAGGLVAIRRATRWDVLLLMVLFSTLIGYFAYWGESYFMGPRFLFTVAPVLLVYAARLPLELSERFAKPAWRAVAMAVPLAWLLSAWVLPADVDRMFGVTTLASTAALPRSAGPAVDRAVRTNGVAGALVFVPESWHGRLAARLRALGVRPLQAEEIVKTYDACTIQRALDAAERRPDLTAEARIESVWLAVHRDPPATRLSGMTSLDQIALVPGRALDPVCEPEHATARSSGITLAELLPFSSVDASGALAGPVVYARHMGASNERLRARFPDRRWLVLRLSGRPEQPGVEFDLYAPPSASAPTGGLTSPSR